MKLSDKIERALNDQMREEFRSAYLYLSMAAYFDSTNLSGFARWMKHQAREEMEHGMRFYDHLIARGGKIVLESIEKPSSAWEGPLHAFEATHKHEQKVTGRIHELYALAQSEKDYPVENMLQWFIGEQVEEEAATFGIVEKLRRIDGDPTGLLILDRELAHSHPSLSAGGKS